MTETFHPFAKQYSWNELREGCYYVDDVGEMWYIKTGIPIALSEPRKVRSKDMEYMRITKIYMETLYEDLINSGVG